MDLWIFGSGGKVMSVQCKNCRNCYVFDKEDGEIFEYIVNGEAYCLYPVFKEWCKYE